MRYAHDALVGTGRLTCHGHTLAKVLYTLDRRTALHLVETPTLGLHELPLHVSLSGLLAVTAGPPRLPVGQPCELILDDGERLLVVLQPRHAVPDGEYRVAAPARHLPATAAHSPGSALGPAA